RNRGDGHLRGTGRQDADDVASGAVPVRLPARRSRWRLEQCVRPPRRAIDRVEGVERMQKVTPFLWFDGKAEEAMNLYVALFKNARIVELHRAGGDGRVTSGTFEIDGVKYHAF